MNADRVFALYDRVADAPDSVVRLRRFVWDLAVRGSLVEQDPADERVASLLAYRGIRASDSQWIEIPATWDWVSVRAVAKSRLGKMLDKSKNTGAPRRYLRNVNVRWFDFDLSDVLEMRFEDAELPEFALQAGDVLICEGGEPGRAAVWDEREDDIYFQKAIHRVRFLDIVDGRYFVNALRASADEGRLAEYFTGTTIKHFTGTALRAYVFPLPPLAEQHRIVAKVDELMALCDQLEETRATREDTRDQLTKANYARLRAPDTDAAAFRSHARFAVDALPALTARADQVKHLRQTILSLAGRGNLVEQDPSDEPAAELLKRIAEVRVRLGVKHVVEPLSANEIPFRLPVGWRWSRIGELCTKTGSGSTPRGGKSVYKKTGVPFLRSQNIYDDGLRLADVACIGSDVHARMAGTAVRARDLLLNITGGSMGRCCRVPDDFAEANISQHVAIIRPAVSEMAAYLHKLVLSPHFQAFIFRKQTGAGRGGLPKNRMDRIPVAVPPLAEQRRIVARVDELMALCDRLETGLGTADDTRSCLLESILRDVLGSAQPERATDGHLGNEVHDPRVYGAGTPRQCTEPRSLSLRPIQDPNLGVTNGV